MIYAGLAHRVEPHGKTPSLTGSGLWMGPVRLGSPVFCAVFVQGKDTPGSTWQRGAATSGEPGRSTRPTPHQFPTAHKAAGRNVPVGGETLINPAGEVVALRQPPVWEARSGVHPDAPIFWHRDSVRRTPHGSAELCGSFALRCSPAVGRWEGEASRKEVAGNVDGSGATGGRLADLWIRVAHPQKGQGERKEGRGVTRKIPPAADLRS